MFACNFFSVSACLFCFDLKGKKEFDDIANKVEDQVQEEIDSKMFCKFYDLLPDYLSSNFQHF